MKYILSAIVSISFSLAYTANDKNNTPTFLLTLIGIFALLWLLDEYKHEIIKAIKELKS